MGDLLDTGPRGGCGDKSIVETGSIAKTELL